MSLVTWLQSNTSGIIIDKCLHKTLTNSNVTSTAGSGKLIRALNLNGSSYLTMPDLLLNSTMTFATWVKFNTLKGCFILDARLSESGYQPIYYDPNNGILIYSSNGASLYISAGTINANLWYHLCVTINNGIGTLYVNGVKRGSTGNIITPCTGSTTLTVGARHTLVSTTMFHGRLEDIRVYDHCLSLKEVLELAKGLIFHYPFNDELAPSTTNEALNSSWEAYTSYWTIDEKTGHGLKVHRTSSGASPTLALKNNILLSKMAVGETWTFSCYLYVDGLPYRSTQTQISTYGYNEIVTESRDDGYFRVTFTIDTLDTWVIHAKIFDVGIGVSCELKYMQFEKSAFPTPYTKSTRNLSTCVDASGHGWTGTPNDLTYLNNSAVGRLCADFNGTTSGVLVPFIKSDLMTSDYTLAFWIYPDTNLRDTIFGDYQTTGTSSVNIERRATTGNLRIYYGNDIFTDSSSITGISMPQNIWTHIALSYNSTTHVFTIYKNGVKAPVTYTKDVSSYTKTSGLFWIGRDNRSIAPENLDGKLSDFRFYATCLNDWAIQDLYETRLNISKSNDLLSKKIDEGFGTFNVTKLYELQCNELYEIEIPSTYQVLKSLKFNGGQYIDTGIYANQDTSVIMLAKSTSTLNQAFFCSRTGINNLTYSCFIVSSKIRHDYGALLNEVSVNATANLVYRINSRKNVLTVNGVTHTATRADFTSNASTGMFIGASQSSGIGNYLYGEIYSCVIYDDDLMVRNFIPVKRKSDNVLGLYDTVTSLFYTNASGSGAFTAGNEISYNSELKLYKNGIILCREIYED